MLIDLHTHSYPKSDDSFMDVDELIERAKCLGLDGVCLTDHDAFWTIDEARTLSKKHGFLVIPGCEINTDTGHVLVFGLERYEFGMHKPDFLRACVEREGGAIIAAHPYRRRFIEEPARKPDIRDQMLTKAQNDEFFRMCHGIESLNGRGSEVQNQFSLDLSNRLGAGMTGGSDAHRVGQIGNAATEFDERIEGLDDLVRSLREGRFRPIDLNARV